MNGNLVIGKNGIWAALAALMVALVGVSSASAQARQFNVISGSRMQFVSDAPLERITGVSSTVTGQLQINPTTSQPHAARSRFRSAASTTGLALRDQHLRGPDWLDGGRNPNATFEITGVEGATALTPNQTVRLTLRGRFTIHGVTRDMTANRSSAASASEPGASSARRSWRSQSRTGVVHHQPSRSTTSA